MSRVISRNFVKKFSAGFGGRLREAIRQTYGERGISEFCRVSGIARGTVDGYLAGEFVPDVARLEEIVGGLSVDPSWLVFGTEHGKIGFVVESGPRYGLAGRVAAAERNLEEAGRILKELRRELEGGR